MGRTGVFSDVTFDLRRGEVLGFAGLVGAGRTDVGLALFGVAPADSGTIRARRAPRGHPIASGGAGHGIAYLSEDRRKLGLSMPQPVDANITLATLDRYTNRLGLLERAGSAPMPPPWASVSEIRTPSLATPVDLLSGGNQQKTMLAKWLNASPRVLILDEPTRGIDVGAKADVHRFVDELARSGIAVILISSDLPEVLAMSDRVVVLREGRLRAIYDRGEATEERVMTTALGAA